VDGPVGGRRRAGSADQGGAAGERGERLGDLSMEVRVVEATVPMGTGRAVDACGGGDEELSVRLIQETAASDSLSAQSLRFRNAQQDVALAAGGNEERRTSAALRAVRCTRALESGMVPEIRDYVLRLR